MSIQILSLSTFAIEMIDFAFDGIKWQVCSVASDAENCRDVILADNVQILVNGNELILECLGHTAKIYSYQFFKIEIA